MAHIRGLPAPAKLLFTKEFLLTFGNFEYKTSGHFQRWPCGAIHEFRRDESVYYVKNFSGMAWIVGAK